MGTNFSGKTPQEVQSVDMNNNEICRLTLLIRCTGSILARCISSDSFMYLNRAAYSVKKYI